VKLEKEFRKLEAAAGKEFRAEGWHGRPEYERSLDLRYRGRAMNSMCRLRRSHGSRACYSVS